MSQTDVQIGRDERGQTSSPRSRSGNSAITETNLPAQLDERQEAIIETSKLKEMTVEPGIMRVPVDEVTTAANSEQWVVIMDHPVEEDIRFFLPKPRTGWSDDYLLVRVLRWYDVVDESQSIGNADPYALQRLSLYIEYDEADESWDLIQPPSDSGVLGRGRNWIEDRIESIRTSIPSTDRTAFAMFGFIQLGILVGATVAPLIGGTTALQIVAGIAIPLLATLLGLVVTEP